MSKGMGWVVIIVLVAVLATLGYWWYQSEYPSAGWMPQKASETGVAQTAVLPSGADTSDTSLDQDLGAIGTQISAFGSDNASVNAGLSDQQIEQSSL